jgi:3-dehydroquinate synthase
MREILVDLGDRSYPIVIKTGLLVELGERILKLGLKGKAALVTNPLVGGLYADKVMKGLKSFGLDPVLITVPDGEEYKTLKEASAIYDGLIEHRMERSSPIIALGGGVIGDMAGFVAATYLRGVPYIQVPTTLLAQVDSSVGGKTAVNHPKGKNLIGAFYQPKAVFIDPEVLSTLDPREVRAGLPEVVKYGVIWDNSFFKFLEDNSKALFKPGPELIKAIDRSCEIKAAVVSADEKESGLRSILNFGHTFGHAIEALTGYGTFKHGEAVAIGMCMAARLSVRMGLAQSEVERRLVGLLSGLGLPVSPPKLAAEDFIGSMRLDKKVISSRIRFVLATEIGKVILEEVEEGKLREFFGEGA